MPLTDLQKRCAQAIVNIFETGRPDGDYGLVTLLSGDPGHLTYGRSQTTLASGNLYLPVKAYCEAEGCRFGVDLQEYLAGLALRDISLDQDPRLRGVLRNAGEDPIMRDVQDAFFDRVYWNPCLASAQALGVATGLGIAVVYDSTIHGSWGRMRDRTVERFGRLQKIGEASWIRSYVDVRREWLATHSIKILRRTVYRMDALKVLMEQGKWELELPVVVRGITIDESVLADRPVRASAQDVEQRLLRLTLPYMLGEDIKEVQVALRSRHYKVTADSIFGPATDKAVRAFQKRSGLKVDGIVGNATLAALGLG